MKKTKIVTTIGKEISSYETLKEIIKAGCDVVRINLSYGDIKFCDHVIDELRKIEKELKKPVGILLDLNGPTVRIDDIKEDSLSLKKDKNIKIYSYPVLCTESQLSTNYEQVIDNLEVGDIIILSDDNVELVVKEVFNDYAQCQVIKEGVVNGKSAIRLKNKTFKLPFLGQEDYNNIMYALNKKVEFLALSGVSNEQDVLSVMDLLIENGENHLQVISKIENKEAIENIDSIIAVSDGVMIDRTDLSLDSSIEKIPFYQKMVLEKAREKEKIGIIATDMMLDMSESARPERSIVVDIYNAVMDNCDAIVLMGGTTTGKFTIETIDTMSKVLESAEEDFDYLTNLHDTIRDTKQDITSSIAYSVVDSSIRLHTKAIIANTMSGYTPKKISYFRPICHIIAPSPNIETVRSLTMVYGVTPVKSTECHSTDEIVESCVKEAKELLDLIPNDLVIVTGGFPINIGTTNFMKIEEIK